MKPRDIAAIMLAAAIAGVISAGAYNLATQGPGSIPSEIAPLIENVMFTLIGALSGYIAGKDSS
jgi:hypothetical protein